MQIHNIFALIFYLSYLGIKRSLFKGYFLRDFIIFKLKYNILNNIYSQVS